MTKKELIIDKVNKQVNKILCDKNIPLEFKEFIIFLKDKLIEDINTLEKISPEIIENHFDNYIKLIDQLEAKNNQKEINCKDAKQNNKYKN